jgi:hypothetical protein
MDILRGLHGLCGAAALAGAIAIQQVPAAAQRADPIYVAVNSKAEASTRHKGIQDIRNLPPRKRNRCTG